MKITRKLQSGFTLVEILIVIVIIMLLSVFLIPTVVRQYQRFQSDRVRLAIDGLKSQLVLFHGDHRRYPTNEEGLFALLYLTDNYGTVPTMQQPGGPQTMTDPMAGQSQSIGAEALNQPMLNQPNNTMLPGQPNMGGANPMGNPMDSQQMPFGGADMMGGGMPGAMQPNGTAGATGWTYYVHNEQLYTLRRKRPNAYIGSERDLIDNWGQPYRYDSSMTWYGVNQFTGTTEPAIWSAGPDRIDGTDDDIRSWDIEDAAARLMEQQQRAQMQQQQGGGFGIGPESLGMPNQMPGMPGPGMPGQGMPGPGMPGPGMPGPGMPGQGMPNQMPGMPGPGMPGQGMPGTGMPGQGMPGTGMPNQMPGMPI